MSIVNRIFASTSSWSPIALRVPLGIIFVAHGAQKLFGSFGGYGLSGTGQYFASIGLEPGVAMAALAGGAEFFGGLALIFGALTRPASLALAFTMLVAAVSAHGANGLFLDNGGYEYALALLAGSVSLLITGAGRGSVDELITRKLAYSEAEVVDSKPYRVSVQH